MNKRILLILSVLLMAFAAGLTTFMILKNQAGSVINLNTEAQGKNISIHIAPGENYLHKFQLSKLISIKTPPQIVVWIEDTEGNYLQTLYATKKIVTEDWSKAPGDKAVKIERKEALPYWTHKKEQAALDAVSAATPKKGGTVNTKAKLPDEPFLIWAEVNMSTDFNEFYPKEAKAGDANYSGGAMGSGQPALLYRAMIDLESSQSYTLAPAGHSSADGSDGELYEDLSTITTAMGIIDKIEITIE